MSAPDYTKFDAALLAHIAAGKKTAGLLIDDPELRRLASPFCVKPAKPSWASAPPAWRIVDRRLQAMRKAGKLTFSRKGGWAVTTTPA